MKEMNYKIKILITSFFSILISNCIFSQAKNLKFKIYSKLEQGNYYIMTKDSIKHFYTDIDGFKLIKNNNFVISATEKYPTSTVIAYKAIYKRYANLKNYVLEYSFLDGDFVPKYVIGRINVFDNLQLLGGFDKPASRQIYYLQKGDNGAIVELTHENSMSLIYDMLKDFEASKAVMDKNKNKFENVVEAVNLYNNR